MKIPFFRYPDQFAKDGDALTEIFREVGKRGAYIMQKDLRDFEDALAKYLGVKHAIGMANATDALHFGFRAMGIGAGDEVLFASHTFVATAAGVHFAGATPVPVECGADHLMDPKALEAAITPRTKAILPTQLNGRTCNMDAIGAIAKKHGLRIAEDSAQGLGSKFKGKFAGTFGEFGVYSFYPAKNLGCYGDGGALVTNDDKVAREVRLLRDHGRDETGMIVGWGLNSRLDNLQAAFLNYHLKKYDSTVERRREIATLYQEYLGGMDKVVLPPPPSTGDHFDVFQNYEIEAERRDELQAFLTEKGIGTLRQWGGKAVHQFPNLGLTRSLPFTERLVERMLMLPMNLSVTDEEVKYVSDRVLEFYGR